jgi:hypothetical protein
MNDSAGVMAEASTAGPRSAQPRNPLTDNEDEPSPGRQGCSCLPLDSPQAPR